MDFIYCSSLILISGIVVLLPASVSSLGINYGQLGNNLPSPEKAVKLVESIGATKVKIYDANPEVLRAFANTGIQVVVGLGNENLSQMNDSNNAVEWVRVNVKKYLPATKITCITIGNEVLTFNDSTLSADLLPAMMNVHAALVGLGLDKQVNVTTAHSFAILKSSYPPSAGAFRSDLIPYLCPILMFLSKYRYPFLINAYPYFAYKGNPKQVALDYVLFRSDAKIYDSASHLHYDNMLFAQIDAVHTALGSVGYGTLDLHISETGWPSKGDADEAGATPENAMYYNGNLMKLMTESKGTPMKPAMNLNIFLFALFNENQKPGATSERNYGLFKPDGTLAYALPNIAAAGNKSSGSAPTESSPPPQRLPNGPSPGSSIGYLSISAAEDRDCSVGIVLLCWACWMTTVIYPEMSNEFQAIRWVGVKVF